MQVIIGVKFKSSPKTYYFDPMDIPFSEGDGAVVETARGVEYGKVIIANRELEENEDVPPVIKPIIRKATEDDEKQLVKIEELRAQAFELCSAKVTELVPQMKLVDIEYTFDQSKVIFYFTADGRVDFRELVRVLAGILKRRIEMRQIDERDDYKMRGSLALCGRPCCCSHKGNFDKVSIKMAKVQGLPLNPTKISGMCGRLMCCLKYENDYYAETGRRMPKVGSEINTPDGKGIVESVDMLRERCKVRREKADGIEAKYYTLDQLGRGYTGGKAPVEEDADDADEDISKLTEN